MTVMLQVSIDRVRNLYVSHFVELVSNKCFFNCSARSCSCFTESLSVISSTVSMIDATMLFSPFSFLCAIA